MSTFHLLFRQIITVSILKILTKDNSIIGNPNPNVFTYSFRWGRIIILFHIRFDHERRALGLYMAHRARAAFTRWAYGYIQSKYGYRNCTDASQMIQRMRSGQHSVRCDSIGFILVPKHGRSIMEHRLLAESQSDFRNFIANGFKTIVITEPYITQPSLNFAEQIVRGILRKIQTRVTFCILVVVRLQRGSSRYNESIRTKLVVEQILFDLFNRRFGFMDRSWRAGKRFTEMKFYGGTDSKIHNIYDFLWAETLFEGFNNSFPNQRLFNLTRSGYAGIQRLGVVTGREMSPKHSVVSRFSSRFY